MSRKTTNAVRANSSLIADIQRQVQALTATVASLSERIEDVSASMQAASKDATTTTASTTTPKSTTKQARKSSTEKADDDDHDDDNEKGA